MGNERLENYKKDIIKMFRDGYDMKYVIEEVKSEFPKTFKTKKSSRIFAENTIRNYIKST